LALSDENRKFLEGTCVTLEVYGASKMTTQTLNRWNNFAIEEYDDFSDKVWSSRADGKRQIFAKHHL